MGYRSKKNWPVPASRLLLLLGLVGSLPVAHAQQLLPVGAKPEMGLSATGLDLPATDSLSTVRLTAIGPDGELQFQTSTDELDFYPADLVRWSNPRDLSPASCLLLTDGSRIVFSEPWDGQPPIALEAAEVTVHSSLLGNLSLARGLLRAIVLNGPAESGQFDRLLTRLLAWQGPGDRLHLVGDDQLVGHLLGIGPVLADKRESNKRVATVGAAAVAAAPRVEDVVLFECEAGRLSIPASRVVGLSLQPEQVTPKALTGSRLGVGLRDGSWLVCDRLAGCRGDASTNSLRLHLLAGLEWTCSELRNLVALQQLGATAAGSPLVYLSDLEAADYRHQAYLDIPWEYRTDHSVRGGRLRVNGRIYLKGLGMHSAARLTYHIPGKWERLAAQVAIDGVSGERGSVVFRVELCRADEWLEAYRSPVVRGGQPPTGLTVDLAGAEQLALITEYADRGDEWDDADWLDARLER